MNVCQTGSARSRRGTWSNSGKSIIINPDLFAECDIGVTQKISQKFVITCNPCECETSNRLRVAEKRTSKRDARVADLNRAQSASRADRTVQRLSWVPLGRLTYRPIPAADKSRLLLSDHPVPRCFYSSALLPARLCFYSCARRAGPRAHMGLLHTCARTPETVMNRVASSRARARACTCACLRARACRRAHARSGTCETVHT